MVRHSFWAMGDPRITAGHETTLEITKEGIKSDQGDCIVATRSELGLADLPKQLKDAAQTKGVPIALVLEASGLREVVKGKGDPRLTFRNPEEMVARKSHYICDRTLMVGADRAATDLNRRFVELLRSKGCRIRVTIVVGEEP